MCVCTVRCEVVWVSNINAETQKLSLCLPAVLCSTFMTERIIFLHNPVWAPDCVGGHGIQPHELSSSDWVMGLFVRLGGGQGPGCVCQPSRGCILFTTCTSASADAQVLLRDIRNVTQD